jgi:hypothetical protein
MVAAHMLMLATCMGEPTAADMDSFSGEDEVLQISYSSVSKKKN